MPALDATNYFQFRVQSRVLNFS